MLVLAHDVIIPAHTEAIMHVLVNATFNYMVLLVESLRSLNNSALAVTAAVVQPLHGKTECRIIDVVM